MVWDYLPCNRVFTHDYDSTIYNKIGDDLTNGVLCFLGEQFSLNM